MRHAALLALFAAAPAAAQPPARYPKPPVDADRDAEDRSGLWESATHPAKAPYAAALDEGRRKLEQRTQDAYAAAAHLGDHAIELLPAAPDAYELRGRAYLGLADWPKCADDLAAAITRTRDDGKLPKDLRRLLGVCQARAGRLGEAEATLTEAVALAPRDRDVLELWTRLGEVRVAMGKLDEAIAAYDTAVSEAMALNVAISALTYWQRAGAYDRARQPSKAEEDVRLAMNNDRSKSLIDSGGLPLLGAGEHELMFGIANQYAEQPSVEAALLYFRRFLALAPASPWRRRVEEHVREMAAVPLPQAVLRASGNAVLDQDAATKVVRAGMPRLRACLAKLPATMIEVRITRSGPKDTAPPVRFHAPPPGVQSTPLLDLDAKVGETPTALDAAIRCLEPLADKLPLPPVKEKETYYQVVFSVVAP